MADETPDNEATATADLYHRHGDPDPSKWNEAESVTDRPNDTPLEDVPAPSNYAVPNSTFADRAKAEKAAAKQVTQAEDKAVTTARTKRPRSRKRT